MPRIDLLPVILDFEASGFGSGSYPIEVGVALPDSSTHCRLIRPEPEWIHWDVQAQSVHGITREILLERGHDVRECCQLLNEWLGGKTVYSDAWGHDSSWLHLLFDVAESLPRFKLESIRGLLTEAQVQHWQMARQQAMDELCVGRHRASSDALIIQRAWRLSMEASCGV